MSDDDLIRRGDAREILEDEGFLGRSLERLAALPAVAVGVRPLVWDRYGNAQGYGCKYMIYEVGTGWNAVLYPSDAANYQIATGVPEVEAVAACDNDHRARLLAALDLTPAPDAQAVREAAEVIERNGAEVTAAAMLLHIADTLRTRGKAVLTTEGDDFGAQVLQFAALITAPAKGGA